MDKSKLPKMQPGKVVPTHGGPAKPKKKPGTPKKGGLAGAMEAIKERRRRQKEALEL